MTLRVAFLFIEVRVEPQLPGSPDIFHAEITRGDAAALELREGDTIYVRALRIPAVELATAGAV